MDIVLLEVGKDFPMIGNDAEMSYLDSASTALTPQVVIDAMADYYTQHNTNTSRGVDKLLYATTELFEAVRLQTQQFLQAKSADEIIFTRGTTDGLNIIAFGLQDFLLPGDEIVINIAEHHANIIPWQEIEKRTGAVVVYCELAADGSIDVSKLPNVLSEKTKVVSFAHVTNVLGSYNDPKQVTKLVRTHAPNALVVIDGAQGIVQEAMDVQTVDCDFYVFSGHKLFGPTGVGVLYGKLALLNKMQPLTFGGDMNFNVAKSGSEYKDAPHKFESGTMMISEVLGLGAAIAYITAIGYEAKHAHISELRAYAFEQLAACPNIIIYNKDADNSTTIAFNIQDVPAHDAASMFSNNQVVLRAGHHCAQLLLEHIDAPSSLRASFSIYNTKADVDAFVNVVKLLQNEGAFLDVLFG